jgi:hypothetical protein
MQSEYTIPEPETIFPEWMSEADEHMLNIECFQPVPWKHFGGLAAHRGEFGIIEQRRFDECSVVPGPDNDGIVGRL